MKMQGVQSAIVTGMLGVVAATGVAAETKEAAIGYEFAAFEGDFDGDGASDRVALIRGEGESADLLLHLGGAEAPALELKGFVWAGSVAGTFPHVGDARKGAFVVASRDVTADGWRWEQKLTVDHTDGVLRVAHFDYEGYDHQDPDRSLSCSFDLVTGDGFLDYEAATTTAAATPLAEWRTDAHTPENCRPRE